MQPQYIWVAIVYMAVLQNLADQGNPGSMSILEQVLELCWEVPRKSRGILQGIPGLIYFDVHRPAP